MQDGKYMNVTIVQLIFMKESFPWFPKLMERPFFERSDILKTFSQLLTEQKPGFLFRNKC